ncbi:helix-turn-helix transcriptional regulator [Arthrobacter sp. MDT1-48-3]
MRRYVDVRTANTTKDEWRQSGPGSQTALRAQNLERIRNVLRHQGSATQIEIAHHTGLSPATVSNLVSKLEKEAEVVCAVTVRSGRRAKLVSLNPATDS